MATILTPLEPATPGGPRMVTIAADLLPEEIVAARRARRTRGRLLVILVLVVALLAAWYLYAVRQKNAADQDLQVVTAQAASLGRSANTDFTDVISVQSQSAALDGKLKTAMANDLPWATMIDTLNRAATDAKVQLTGITGSLTAVGTGAAAASSGTATGASSGTGNTLPSTSAAATIGTLVLTGTAPDKPSIAKFMESLGALRAVANPYLTSSSKTDNGLQYSLQADITDSALCGQFTTRCMKGGK